MSDTGTQNSTVESDDDLKRLLPDMDEVVGDLRDVMRRGKRSPKIWMERAGCLSSGRLSAFADGRSNDPVSDRMHVLNCRYCRQSLKDLDLPGLDARHIGEALSHPGFDGLVAFLGGTLSEKDRRNVDGHLQACGECREALAAMKTAESDSSIRILRNPSKVKNSGRMGAHDETPSQTGIAYSRLAPVRYAAHSASEGERHLPRETIPAGDLLFEDSDSSAHLFRKAGKITVSIIAPPEISIEVDGVASDGVPLKIARRKRVNETCFSFSREHAKFPVSLTLSIGTRQEIIIIRD